MHQIGQWMAPGSGDPCEVLFVQGANPVVMCPDTQAVVAAFSRDDVFTVVHEQVLTDTTRFADVVLPATTSFEIHDATSSYGVVRRDAGDAGHRPGGRGSVERRGRPCAGDSAGLRLVSVVAARRDRRPGPARCHRALPSVRRHLPARRPRGARRPEPGCAPLGAGRA